MRSVSLSVVSSLALLVVVGCGKEEPTPKPAPAAPAAPAAQAPAPAAPAKDVVKDVQTQAKTVVGDAAAQGQAAVKDVATQGQTAINNAVAQGQTAAGDLTAMATQKLDEAIKYIRGNKVDAADKVVTELEGRKASLPATILGRLADVRKMVDTAKAAKATGLTLPKF